LLIFIACVFVGYVIGSGNCFRRQREDLDLAVFGRPEVCFVFLEKGRQRRVRRFFDFSDGRVSQKDVIGGSGFELIGGQSLKVANRRCHVPRDTQRKLVSFRSLPPLHDVFIFLITIGAQNLIEPGAFVAAARATEGGIRLDQRCEALVRDTQFQILCRVAQGCLGNQSSQSLLWNAERSAFFGRERPAELLRKPVEVLAVGAVELEDAYFGLADLCCGVLTEALQEVGDAPDGETKNQQCDKQFGNPGAGAFAQ